MPLISMFFFLLFCFAFFLNTGCYVLFPLSVKNILFPHETRQKLRQGKEMEKESRRMNTGWQQEACVPLVNGTFVWPVTFSCSRTVYYRRSLFVRETAAKPSRPCIMLILHDFLCKVLFPWPYDSLFASQYTHYIPTFSICVFFSPFVSLCVYRHW